MLCIHRLLSAISRVFLIRYLENIMARRSRIWRCVHYRILDCDTVTNIQCNNFHIIVFCSRYVNLISIHCIIISLLLIMIHFYFKSFSFCKSWYRKCFSASFQIFSFILKMFRSNLWCRFYVFVSLSEVCHGSLYSKYHLQPCVAYFPNYNCHQQLQKRCPYAGIR